MTDIQDLQNLFEEEVKKERGPRETPDIGIIMGSDSDLDVMYGAYEALNDLGFSEITNYNDLPDEKFTFETFVISAHRTPELMYSYANTASDRGLDVIIAGAGGKSADLPNMTASIAYPIPVIGVPVQEKSVSSVIGMPKGAPITAVDAGKSYNAALSAVQILSRSHKQLITRLKNLHNKQKSEVAKISKNLHELGIEKFRKNKF